LKWTLSALRKITRKKPEEIFAAFPLESDDYAYAAAPVRGIGWDAGRRHQPICRQTQGKKGKNTNVAARAEGNGHRASRYFVVVAVRVLAADQPVRI
jgi:hypothetical protein